MKFEGDRTNGRLRPRTRSALATDREPVVAGGEGEAPLRARSRTYLQPLGMTIDRGVRG